MSFFFICNLGIPDERPQCFFCHGGNFGQPCEGEKHPTFFSVFILRVDHWLPEKKFHAYSSSRMNWNIRMEEKITKQKLSVRLKHSHGVRYDLCEFLLRCMQLITDNGFPCYTDRFRVFIGSEKRLVTANQIQVGACSNERSLFEEIIS
ncbi:hypothetical protein TNCV_2889441 [Trichonephila clavipes]|nr:hypothetical protein TNCV_2889441 [Trichonephila clavipes]